MQRKEREYRNDADDHADTKKMMANMITLVSNQICGNGDDKPIVKEKVKENSDEVTGDN